MLNNAHVPSSLLSRPCLKSGQNRHHTFDFGGILAAGARRLVRVALTGQRHVDNKAKIFWKLIFKGGVSCPYMWSAIRWFNTNSG